MALTASEQDLYDFARRSLPGWFFQITRSEEILTAAAKVFGRVRENLGESRARKLITQAEGVWLDLHAADRNTRRQDGESNESLRARLRNVEDAVTPAAILAVVQAILTAELVSGDLGLVELRRDGIHLGTLTARSGVGGTFVDEGGGDFSFTPDTAPQAPVRVGQTYPAMEGNPRMVISGAANAGNDGTFEITALSEGALMFANGSGVAGVDATASWEIHKYNAEGYRIDDSMASAFLSRGYRLKGATPTTKGFVIMPSGTTEAMRLSAEEAVRQKKAAGVVSHVERDET